MGKIAFVTDSTAYLTQEQVEKYQIHVVPLGVIFGDHVYQEGVDLSTDEFYQRLQAGEALPTTSQPPIGEFVSLFERLLETHDDILCLMLSDKLSGTYRTAVSAAEMVNAQRIHVVDSRIASYGIAGPVMDGAELASHGATVEQILELWERVLAGQHAYFILDTLEYLHKGGRIGGAAAAFGALLQIKPILTLVDGRIDLFEKVRTHRRAMEHMFAQLESIASSGVSLKLAVVHSHRLADAVALRDDLAVRFPNIELEVSELGPVIGAHTGPGVLAFVFYSNVLRDVQ